MDKKDMEFRYGFVVGRRFYRGEKLRFLRGAAREFFDLKMDVDVKEARQANRRAYNLYAGDMGKADLVLTAYYDTPPKTFGLTKHRAFEEDALKKSYRLAFLIPTIAIALLGAAIFGLLMGNGVQPAFSIGYILSLLPVAILVFLLYRCRNGIGNRINLVRNTSGVLAAIGFAQQLGKRERSRLAIALSDYGCINNFGNLMLREVMGKQADKKTVVMLDSIGGEGDIHVLYRKGCEDSIVLMERATDSLGKNVHFHKLDVSDKRYYNHFEKGIMICAGHMDAGSIIVNDAGNRRNAKINSDNMDCVSAMLAALYKNAADVARDRGLEKQAN